MRRCLREKQTSTWQFSREPSAEKKKLFCLPKAKLCCRKDGIFVEWKYLQTISAVGMSVTLSSNFTWMLCRKVSKFHFGNCQKLTLQVTQVTLSKSFWIWPNYCNLPKQSAVLFVWRNFCTVVTLKCFERYWLQLPQNASKREVATKTQKLSIKSWTLS